VLVSTTLRPSMPTGRLPASPMIRIEWVMAGSRVFSVMMPACGVRMIVGLPPEEASAWVIAQRKLPWFPSSADRVTRKVPAGETDADACCAIAAPVHIARTAAAASALLTGLPPVLTGMAEPASQRLGRGRSEGDFGYAFGMRSFLLGGLRVSGRDLTPDVAPRPALRGTRRGKIHFPWRKALSGKRLPISRASGVMRVKAGGRKWPHPWA
jgi:hypothetical protein